MISTHTHAVRPSPSGGFSLVELSVVLVILGLLVGGVLGGRALISAAELQAIPAELQRWQAAVGAFEAKYNALPGDFNEATLYWGAAASCPPAAGAAALGNGTCNGNGNYRVGDTTGTRYESLLFWHHLSRAGLVPGEFTGTPGSAGTSDHVIGQNAPPSKFPQAGWSTLHFTGGSTNQYELEYGNTLVIGAQRPGLTTNNKALTPEQAWSLDSKMDDGLPASGRVIAHWLVNECSGANSGAHTSTNLDASYRLHDTSRQCSLYFRRAY